MMPSEKRDLLPSTLRWLPVAIAVLLRYNTIRDAVLTCAQKLCMCMYVISCDSVAVNMMRKFLSTTDSKFFHETASERITKISVHSCLTKHTHMFNGPFSLTTQVSRYQKGKTNLDFTEARDSEWQWHQLGRMQVCTSLQTDNHASTTPLEVFCRPDAFPATQPTASKH